MHDEIPAWLLVPLVVIALAVVAWQRRAALRAWLGLGLGKGDDDA